MLEQLDIFVMAWSSKKNIGLSNFDIPKNGHINYASRAFQYGHAQTLH